MLRMHKIRFIAVAYFAAICILGTLSYITYNEALGLIKMQFNKQQMFVAVQTARTIEKNITSFARGLQNLKTVFVLRKFSIQESRSLMAQTFKNVKGLYVNDLLFVDAKGMLRVSIMSPQLEGRQFHLQETFRKVERSKSKDVFFEFIKDTKTNLMGKGIIICCPVVNDSGTLHGMLAFIININDLINSFVPYDLAGSKTCVVNKKGDVLCNPRDMFKGTGVMMDDVSLRTIYGELKAGEIYSGEYRTQTGEQALAAVYPINILGDTWSMVIATPEYVLKNLLSPFTKKYILVTLIVLIALVSASYFVINLMNKWNIALDKTVRERTLELSRAEENQRMLMETINEIIWETDREGTYTYVSPACIKILGYSPDELTEKSIYDIMPQEEIQDFKTILNTYADNKKPFNYIERISLHKNGSPMCLETNGMPLFDAQRQVIGFRGADRDITLRKHDEKELQHYAVQLEEARNSLEHKVEERTRELKIAHRDLIRKEKASVLGQLSITLSHELRNPLGVIKNAIYYFNMKREQFSDEVLRNNIDIISNEIGIANKIISDILNFSRDSTPVRLLSDINQLVLEMLSKSTIPEAVTVTTALANNLPLLSLDPTQIAQIFTNLISNAIEAMSAGGTLRITTRSAGNSVEVVFEDEGDGIDDDLLNTIFEPLFTTKAKGIGLGLAIAKNLAEANDAELSVQNREDRGAIFTLRFTRE
ncbi:ATP-binding protein [Thermodesulfobacteriota bacterium]